MVGKQHLFGILVDTKDHNPNLGWNDFANPQSWRPSCSCGWEGLVIYRESDFKKFPEILQDFVKANGLDSILDKNAVFGNEDKALVQILDHLEYEPENDFLQAETALDSITSQLKELNSENSQIDQDTFELLEELSAAGQEFLNYKKRAYIWRNVEIPIMRDNAEFIEVSLKEFLLNYWETLNNSKDTAN